MQINGKAAAAAFVKARAAIGATVNKDAKGNYGRYATLAAVMEAITPALSANGLALVQEAIMDDAWLVMRAVILHESGETIEFEPLPMPLGTQRTAQSVGSAMTYGRRYQLTALFGLAPDDDDDGQAASKTLQDTQNGRATSQRTAMPANARPSVSTTPTAHVDDAAPLDENGPETLFETAVPTEREAAILNAWLSPEDAKAWAVNVGACENEFEARNSLKKIVDGVGGGRLRKENAAAIYLAFLRRQMEKLAERQPEIEVAAVESLPF